jgi:hypothetical protein
LRESGHAGASYLRAEGRECGDRDRRGEGVTCPVIVERVSARSPVVRDVDVSGGIKIFVPEGAEWPHVAVLPASSVKMGPKTTAKPMPNWMKQPLEYKDWGEGALRSRHEHLTDCLFGGEVNHMPEPQRSAAEAYICEHLRLLEDLLPCPDLTDEQNEEMNRQWLERRLEHESDPDPEESECKT